MAQLKQSTAYTRTFLMVLSSDHITGATGLSPVVTLSKAGGAFGAAGGAVAEVGNGVYKVSLNTTDTNTLGDLAIHAAVATADPSDMTDQVVAFDPADGVRLGLTALPNAAAAASGGLPTLAGAVPFANAGATGGLPTVDSTNSVKIQTPVKKNTALANFQFVMLNSSGNPQTGLTVTATRAIDGAAFGACTNAVTELANGWYLISLAAADLNGTTIALRFTATGQKDTNILLLTLP